MSLPVEPSGQASAAAAPVIATGRMVRSVDFQQALRQVPRARSAHFSMHHVRAGGAVGRKGDKPELSTGEAADGSRPVDDSQAAVARLGCVVPKRLARRAVTRALMKRQIRAAFARNVHRLSAGCWLVRLRAPFDPAVYTSAASDALRAAARRELDGLFQRIGPARPAPSERT